MSKYPKEILDALERDLGITIGKLRLPDERLCYGVGCTWFGPIQEVKITETGLPCCPYCGSMLYEMANEAEWWESVDQHERAGHPGYRGMWEWQRTEKQHFLHIASLAAAYTKATGNKVKLS